MKWESPRGPISIDPETRDIVQNIYIRKVEKVDGELYNVEFATFEAVKDPARRRRSEAGLALPGRGAPRASGPGAASRRGREGLLAHRAAVYKGDRRRTTQPC